MLTNCFTEYLFDIRLSIFLLKDDVAVFHLKFFEHPHRSHHVRRGTRDKKRMKMRQIMRMMIGCQSGRAGGLHFRAFSAYFNFVAVPKGSTQRKYPKKRPQRNYPKKRPQRNYT